MMPYERFKAWQLCHSLALDVYRATNRFPGTERFGLISQTRRSAFSAAANIVEGSAKRGTKEFRRFLDVSLGSLVELSYWLRVARDLELLEPGAWGRLDRLRDEASRVTWGLYNAISKRVLS